MLSFNFAPLTGPHYNSMHHGLNNLESIQSSLAVNIKMFGAVILEKKISEHPCYFNKKKIVLCSIERVVTHMEFFHILAVLSGRDIISLNVERMS